MSLSTRSRVLSDARKGGKVPVRVAVYFVMAMALLYGDSYEEVMRKLVSGLRYIGTWRREWDVPSASGISQARQRLGAGVMREIFDRVAVPCALRSTAGAWLAGRRLTAVDGFGVEAPDTPENAAYFGYAGKKEKGVLPFVRMAGMVECGTHAIVAAEIGKDGEGEETLASRIQSGGAVEPGMIVMADAGLYSYRHLRMIIDAGADAVLRVGANVSIPLLEWLPDGSYLSYLADPGERRKNSHKPYAGKIKITDLPGTYVRAIDYQVTDRGDCDELITLVTTMTDPGEISAMEIAAAYHERWEAELVFDEIKTHQRGPGAILRSRKPMDRHTPTAVRPGDRNHSPIRVSSKCESARRDVRALIPRHAADTVIGNLHRGGCPVGDGVEADSWGEFNELECAVDDV